MSSMDHTTTSLPRIVVGVDRSHDAARALRWAVDEASRRGAVVEIVSAWRPAYSYTPGMALRLMSDEAEAEAASTVIDHALANAAIDEPAPGTDYDPAIVRTVMEGPPAEVLAARGVGALMIVVGRHGEGLRAHLGSVAHSLLRRATVPVVVIPPEHRREPSQR